MQNLRQHLLSALAFIIGGEILIFFNSHLVANIFYLIIIILTACYDVGNALSIMQYQGD